jgi:hypothetical protein
MGSKKHSVKEHEMLVTHVVPCWCWHAQAEHTCDRNIKGKSFQPRGIWPVKTTYENELTWLLTPSPSFSRAQWTPFTLLKHYNHVFCFAKRVARGIHIYLSFFKKEFVTCTSPKINVFLGYLFRVFYNFFIL